MTRSKSKRALQRFRQQSLDRRVAALVEADREQQQGSFAPQPAPYSIMDDLERLAHGNQ